MENLEAECAAKVQVRVVELLIVVCSIDQAGIAEQNGRLICWYQPDLQTEPVEGQEQWEEYDDAGSDDEKGALGVERRQALRDDQVEVERCHHLHVSWNACEQDSQVEIKILSVDGAKECIIAGCNVKPV